MRGGSETVIGLVPFNPSAPAYSTLLITWLYGWMGGADDYVIRWVPPLFGVMLILYIIWYLMNRGVSLAQSFFFALMFSTSGTFIHVCTEFYAEPLLLLQATVGFTLLRDYLQNSQRKEILSLAFWLIAGTAWIKLEGAIFYSVAFLVMSFLTPKRQQLPVSFVRLKDVVWVVLPAVLFVMPWQIFRSLLGLWPEDFVKNPLAAVTWDRLEYFGRAFLFLLKGMFLDIRYSGFAGILFLVGIFLVDRSVRRSTSSRFWIWSAFGLILSFAMVFFFTLHEKRDAFEWHLLAAYRLLLLPMVIAVVCVGEWEYRNNASILATAGK